jgi:hypothetical protein
MFKTIPGFPNYEVSKISEVRGKRFGRILKPKVHDGYHSVGLYMDGKYHWRNVHRLCAMAWVGVPENAKNLDVAHNDGVRSNNVVSNLRWVTRKDNIHDRYSHGTAIGAHPGERHHNAKLTSALVIEMRERVANGERFMDVVFETGVKKLTAYDAVTGKTWSTLNEKMPPVSIKSVKVKAENVRQKVAGMPSAPRANMIA